MEEERKREKEKERVSVSSVFFPPPLPVLWLLSMICRTAERFHLLHWLDDPTLTNMYGLGQTGRALITIVYTQEIAVPWTTAVSCGG